MVIEPFLLTMLFTFMDGLILGLIVMDIYFHNKYKGE